MNLILFGFKRSGKTLFGKLVARKLSRPFVDVDDMIYALYEEQFHEKLSCREIAKKHGEGFFREREKQAVKTLSPVHDVVIAVGGGAVLDPDNLNALEKLGQLVYLKVEKAILKERLLSQGELPSYLDPNDPEGSFEQMYQRREPMYEIIPAITVDASHRTEEAIVEAICKIVEQKEAEHGE